MLEWCLKNYDKTLVWKGRIILNSTQKIQHMLKEDLRILDITVVYDLRDTDTFKNLF